MQDNKVKTAKHVLAVVFLIAYIILLAVVTVKYLTSNSQWEIELYQTEITAMAGQEVTIKANIKNKMYYDMSSESNYFISYHIYDVTGELIQYENPRIKVGLIKPGNSKEIEITIKVPEEKGKYIYEIDMVKENSYWFKDRGEQPGIVYVTVN